MWPGSPRSGFFRARALLTLVLGLLVLVTGCAGPRPRLPGLAGDAIDPRHPPAAAPIRSGAQPASAPDGAADDYPPQLVTVIAHRGASPGFPENTLAAVRHAIEIGVDATELDLRVSADGAIVLFHDASVGRTTDGRGRVSRMSLAQLQALDAGSQADPRFAGERIPTLDQALMLARDSGVRLLLDIKDGGGPDPARLLADIVRHDATDVVIVAVRNLTTLRQIRALAPTLTVLALIRGPESIATFAGAGADIIRLWPARAGWTYDDRDSSTCRRRVAARLRAYAAGRVSDPGSRSCLVQRIHRLGLRAWANAGNAPYEDLDELVRLGFDGILTNLPELLILLRDDIAAHRAAGATDARGE